MTNCPQCSQPVMRVHKFCRQCGTKLNRFTRRAVYLGAVFLLVVSTALVWSLTNFSPSRNTPETVAQVPLSVEKAEGPAVGITQIAKTPSAVENVTDAKSTEVAQARESGGENKESRSDNTGKEASQLGLKLSPPAGWTPGEYQIVRSTYVFNEPRNDASKTLSLEPGTQVLVVNMRGDWLEIRSYSGRPPGFIHRESAKFLKRIE